VTFPPERVMSALAPLTDDAPSIQPQNGAEAEDRAASRKKPLFHIRA
jgi:two-component system cell cycle sensor histidine kinase PleC